MWRCGGDREPRFVHGHSVGGFVGGCRLGAAAGRLSVAGSCVAVLSVDSFVCAGFVGAS